MEMISIFRYKAYFAQSLGVLVQHFIRIATLLLALSLSGVCLAQTGNSSKAVAVVYDDSGSMSTNQRWVRANYALKVLAASLREDDTLLIVRMSKPSVAEHYSHVAGLNNAIAVLQRQTGVENSTPYQTVRTAVDELLKRPESEKWLVIISDGGFNDYDETLGRQDIQRALNAGIHSAFVLIEQQSNQAAEDWKGKGNATIFDARTASVIVSELEAAAALLNGQSRGGIKVRTSGNEVRIDSIFPLRRLTVLRQDSTASDLRDVTMGTQSASASELRLHRFSPNLQMPNLGLPNEARVYHIKNKDNRVIEAGEGAIRMNFDGDAASIRLKLLPDIAAQFSIELVDAGGKAIPRDKSGTYMVCDSTYRVVARLVDDIGKPLTAGRTDISMFSVAAVINGASHPLGIDAQQAVFAHDFAAGKPGSEAAISGTAQYPGYFHKLSAPVKVRFAECRRNIALKIIDGTGPNGVWQANVEGLEKAPLVRLAVTVDGKPASAAEMAKWRFDFGAQSGMLETRLEDGAILVRPRPFCCVWWWNEAGAGQYVMPIKLVTGSAYDTINAPPSLTFLISPPETTLDKFRWYACPFVLLAALLSFLWYLLRLLRKSRFGPDARFEAEEEMLSSGAIRPRTSVLREHSNAAKRWLWPSRGEVAELYGIRFHAFGEDVIADGRDLQKKHKIPGWVFDRSRLEASRKKDRRQENAALSDKMVMTIDEGDFVIRVRYRLQ